MKRAIVVAFALLAVLPVASFALDVVVNPYSQLNAGDVLATSFPQVGTNTSGIQLNTTMDLGAAGKLTVGLDNYLKAKLNNTFTTFTYDWYEDPFFTYAISIVSVKTEFPLDLISSATGAAVLPVIYVTPSTKFALDKSSALSVVIAPITLYVTGAFNVDITPRVAYSNGPLSAYVQLTVPSLLTAAGTNLSVRADAAYKLPMGLSLEGYATLGSINNGTKPLTLTPAVKVSYSTTVKF